MNREVMEEIDMVFARLSYVKPGQQATVSVISLSAFICLLKIHIPGNKSPCIRDRLGMLRRTLQNC